MSWVDRGRSRRNLIFGLRGVSDSVWRGAQAVQSRMIASEDKGDRGERYRMLPAQAPIVWAPFIPGSVWKQG